MKQSVFYLKKLTAAEVGKTRAHVGGYIRLPNDFDYELFFQSQGEDNNGVTEIIFNAHNCNRGVVEKDLRFVYFGNSNREKRIPNLASLFRENDVKKGDVVKLESCINDGVVQIYIQFFKNSNVTTQATNIYYVCEGGGRESTANESKLKEPHQQIFYGAPGTGKSKTIKDKTEDIEKEDRVFRTTFHPDSDYSTFVGAYKPSMKTADNIYSSEELAVKLKEIKNSGVTYPCHKFAAQYWRSLKDLNTNTIKEILSACGFTEAYAVEVAKSVAIGQDSLNKEEDGKIIYKFTPQAFTNAYVKAWNTEEKVYLIIEEINRGNCAQIFGDLFQLLDRKKGYSEYPINADTDLGNYINGALKDSTRTDFPDGVKEGKKLVLPPNLFIWATMNTSDQSLFPIDSAFKRRWDWKYIPIKPHDKGYIIKINNSTYDWWGFLKKINFVIGDKTSSEDKKLGYFFVKAEDKEINSDKFVGKVLFYLWNDVFKNYGFDHDIFNKNKDENDKFEFSDFFNEDGSPDTDMVNLFLKKLDETIDKYPTFVITGEENNEPSSALIVKYKGEEIEGAYAYSKYFEIVSRVCEEKGPEIVADCIGDALTQTPAEDSTRKYKAIGDTGWYLATNIGIEAMKTKLNKIRESLNVDIVIE